MELIKTELMPDSSEVIPYDRTGIPLYIRTSYLSTYQNMCAPCHWHDDIEWIYIMDGKMRYYVNGKRLILNKGDSLMINARQMHYGYDYEKQNCYFTCILFHPSLFGVNKMLYEQYFLPFLENSKLEYFHFQDKDKDRQKVESVLLKIVALKKEGKPSYELQVISMMIQLWSEFIQEGKLSDFFYTKTGNNKELQIQKDMVSFIYQHYPEKISLKDIANAGHVGRSKCCQMFKHYMQQSPVDFLNSYRLKMSCQLLCTMEKSITEVAFLCGFNHLSYFSKYFSECYGCTPREYREQHR